MINVNLKLFPIILLDDASHDRRGRAYASSELMQAFDNEGLEVLHYENAKDVLAIAKAKRDISCIIVNLEYFPKETEEQNMLDFIQLVRNINSEIPINIITDNMHINLLNPNILRECDYIIWNYDDTASFLAGRIRQQVFNYLARLLPPFFQALVKYTYEYKYAWHTPGHMGGVAFLKSPTGRLFYDYYGENTFRSDLSISVPELGSLLEHSGVVGEAEEHAAQIFGADETYFVTNGTSTSNKIVFMAIARSHDVAAIDRNCHKSLQHALTMANVIPIYFKPSRNAYGIIGGIARSEFSPESLRQKIIDNPLISNKEVVPRLAVITNSTYDGLIYNVANIKEDLLTAGIDYIHFDEAWFPYAKFHPFYQGKFGMSESLLEREPTVFSTQSTHKLLAAFSQASMIHLKRGSGNIEREIFNESFMMHNSTSPQYGIIASLDVSARMMAGHSGLQLMSECMGIAVAFRQEFNKINRRGKRGESTNDWAFKIWQPDEVDNIYLGEDEQFLHDATHNDLLWQLSAKKHWHAFPEIDENHLFLDPIKVTLLTPGIDETAAAQDFGIPAPLVSRYLIGNGVVDEKIGFYSMLFLFSIGVNKSKALTLLTQLEQFKDQFDKNSSLKEAFPDLVQEHASYYKQMTLQDLAKKMHQFLTERQASTLLMNAYEMMPDPWLTPHDAYQALISGQWRCVPLDELLGQVVLTMVAPYPPGIPIIMPGERINENHMIIINFLKLLEDFDNAFPSFENEVHGVKIVENEGGKRRSYYLFCLQDKPPH